MERQVTVRGVSDELAKRLKALAESRNESVNSLVLQLLSQAVGLDERRERLARYVTWNEADLREFNEAQSAQRTIDEALWK